MALSKTYLDLKTAVQSWLNRDDPEVVNNIPQFIMLAEQEFSRLVKIPLDEGTVTHLVDSNEAPIRGIDIPEDCLSPIGVWVSQWDEANNTRYEPKSYVRIDGFAYFDIMSRNDGKPEDQKEKGNYFCKYQNQWLFYPVLQAFDAATITYHKDLVPMASDTDTNASLKYGFDLMLYWSLKHAAVYLRDAEQEQYWDAKAQEAAQTMNKTFHEQHWAGSPLRVLGY